MSELVLFMLRLNSIVLLAQRNPGGNAVWHVSKIADNLAILSHLHFKNKWKRKWICPQYFVWAEILIVTWWTGQKIIGDHPPLPKPSRPYLAIKSQGVLDTIPKTKVLRLNIYSLLNTTVHQDKAHKLQTTCMQS